VFNKKNTLKLNIIIYYFNKIIIKYLIIFYFFIINNVFMRKKNNNNPFVFVSIYYLQLFKKSIYKPRYEMQHPSFKIFIY